MKIVPTLRRLPLIYMAGCFGALGACVVPATVGDSPQETEGGDGGGSGGPDGETSDGSAGSAEPDAGSECDPDLDPDCAAPMPTCDVTGTSQGCAFTIMAGLDVAVDYGDIDRATQVVLKNASANEAATVQLYVVAPGETEEVEDGPAVTVDPGGTHVVDVPADALPIDTTGLRTGGVLRVVSDTPLTATVYGPRQDAHGPAAGLSEEGSALLLPDAAMAEIYVVPSYAPDTSAVDQIGNRAFTQVIALDADTSLRWRSARTMTAGNGLPVPEVPAGQWSPDLVLGRHDVLQLTPPPWMLFEDASTVELSGLVFEATRPVAVIAGTRCSEIPVASEGGDGRCGPMFEHVVPVSRWGQRYVVPRPPTRDGEAFVVRLFAGDDDVSVSAPLPGLGDGPHLLAERGDFIEVVLDGEAEGFELTADGPVMPVGYLATHDDAGTNFGGPAMLQHVPTEQFLRTYPLTTAPGYDAQFAQIVREIGAADVFLDGTAVASWAAIDAFEVATVSLSGPENELSSEDPFGATLFGYNAGSRDFCDPQGEFSCGGAYAHPAGMATAVLWEP